MSFSAEHPHMRQAGIALLSLIVLAALTVAGFAAFLESDYLRSKLSTAGSSKLGRELTIAGPFDIDWRWGKTSVHAEQVRLSNAPGFEDANMLEIETLDFTIKPVKLLFGRLELPELRITGPKIILERKEDGTKNWDLPVFSSAAVTAEAVIPEERGDFPIIGHITVTDGNLIMRDALRDMDMDLKLSTLSGAGSGKDRDDPFTLKGEGTLSGEKLTLDAQGGSLVALRDTMKEYPLRADIVMGATTVHMDGVFRDPLKMEGVDTALAIKGANLADLFYLTSIPFPPTPAYQLDGRIKKDGDVWGFDIPKGRVGNSDVKADGTYDTGRDRGFLKMDVVSNKMHIDDLGGFIGLKPRGNETTGPANKLFPDVPLNLTRLRASDLEVRLKANTLVAPGWPFESLDTRFKLDEGLLRIDPATAGIAGGTMSGHIILDGRKDVPRVETDIMLRRLSLKQFFGESRFEELSSGRFGGRIRIEGSGRSLAEVFGNADGRISAMMAGGQVSLMLIEAAGLDVAEFTMRLLGKDKTTRVRCAIGDFAVQKGMLRSDIFVFDTTDTMMEGEAVIDLERELIDARVETHPKDGSPLSARTPLTIKGPLRKPNIGIDPGQLAARGAGAAALALLNPLAALIPFIETGGGDDTDCRGLIREVRARYGGNIAGPTASEAPATPATKN